MSSKNLVQIGQDLEVPTKFTFMEYVKTDIRNEFFTTMSRLFYYFTLIKVQINFNHKSQ